MEKEAEIVKKAKEFALKTFFQAAAIFTILGLNATLNPLRSNETDSSKFYQIRLSPDMIFDEMSDGKNWSVYHLIDEQYCNPENANHPYSDVWKPLTDQSKDLHHVYIDLGEETWLTGVAFHEMQMEGVIYVSAGEPEDWTPLLTETCSVSNSWTKYFVNANTRYVRFSVGNSGFAAVNEIVLYASRANEINGTEKSGLIETSSTSIDDLLDINNHNQPEITIDGSLIQNNLCVNLPDDLSHDFTLEIYNLSGIKVLKKDYVHNISSRILLDISRECCKSGVYILHYFNNNGVSKTIKFIKRGCE
ncbi:MAG: T9SS type A sorting domain-containing protein [Prolixibacteraceae bacterium]|nr:T9SS type A sorting domain-containing protein [Prolixibacteraceae bacterium]